MYDNAAMIMMNCLNKLKMYIFLGHLANRLILSFRPLNFKTTIGSLLCLSFIVDGKCTILMPEGSNYALKFCVVPKTSFLCNLSIVNSKLYLVSKKSTILS